MKRTASVGKSCMAPRHLAQCKLVWLHAIPNRRDANISHPVGSVRPGSTVGRPGDMFSLQVHYVVWFGGIAHAGSQGLFFLIACAGCRSHNAA